ncbi:MAG: FAD-dependent oxidoreductase [Campylobacterota bacterium]|nr:FAD-dependent oxidoreductase [Campylobacterota bacterium]
MAIIGAGVCGTTLAHFLNKEGLSVAIVDKEAVASGGSGAAGAFISPKIASSGELKALHVKAYDYALKFYNETSAANIKNTPQLHITKYEDRKKLQDFKKDCKYKFSKETPLHVEAILSDEAKESDSIYFTNSATVDAKNMCEVLCEDATFFKLHVEQLKFNDGVYDFGEFSAKKVVITTGAYDNIIDESYIKMRGIWGHRIGVKTTTKIPCIIHHHLSISPTCSDDVVALGATHDVHYKLGTHYDIEKGRDELLQRASKTIELQDAEVVEDFMGLRSGSNDYLPLLGKIVNSKKSIEKFPNLKNGLRVKDDELIYYENLYMMNGVGGYGFVLAPYLSKIVSKDIICNSTTCSEYEPSRFFRRKVKRDR